MERQLRQLVQSCPEPMHYDFYQWFSESFEPLARTAFQPQDEIVLAQQNEAALFFPRPIPMVIMSHIVFGYETWLQHKYALPGFVEVEPGDTVVDCGAYVGGFALSAARVAKRVHVFEPENRNFDCCERNLAQFDNVELVNKGLYSQTKVTALNIAQSSVEHSLLLPDDGAPIGTQPVQLIRLWDYFETTAPGGIDFVKIEAEGVELEVFAGLQDLRPRKLAIDVSEERDGESPAEEFREILLSLGYELRQRGHVMFARLNGAG